MKFDPFKWSEAHEKTKAPKGRLRVFASAPCPLWLEAEGFEALAGYNTAWDLTLDTEVIFWTTDPSVRLFYDYPVQAIQVPQGEVFTNADMEPDESGAMWEVRKAIRALQLERMVEARVMAQALQDIKDERGAEPVVVEQEPAPQ